MDKPDIAQKIKNGDFEAFEHLFKSHYPILKNFALKYMKNTELAEEMVQEVFFNLWAKHSEIYITSSIKAYLFKSTYNCCLQYFKKQEHKSKYESYVLKENVNYQPDPSDELRAKEVLQLVDKALKTLPERCRKIFRLNRFDGLKYQEIADRLSISIKTVEANMGKALKHLRYNLKDYVTILILFGII